MTIKTAKYDIFGDLKGGKYFGINVPNNGRQNINSAIHLYREKLLNVPLNLETVKLLLLLVSSTYTGKPKSVDFIFRNYTMCCS